MIGRDRIIATQLGKALEGCRITDPLIGDGQDNERFQPLH